MERGGIADSNVEKAFESVPRRLYVSYKELRKPHKLLKHNTYLNKVV